MIDHPTFRIASSTVADRQNGLIVGPRVAVISGSAHSPRTATIARCRSLDRFRDTAFCTSRGEFAAEI